ncbi:MAG: hypothetical protein J6X62_01275 [Bacteroidales bacterium]|nr:hypothetical protein [Bacteroidales bacterium]
MHKRHIILLLAVCLGACWTAQGQQDADGLDKEQVRPGEHFVFTSTRQAGATTPFAQPLPDDTIQAIAQTVDTALNKDGKPSAIRLHTTLICFEPGMHNLAIVHPEGPDTSYTTITVDSLPAVDTSSTADIRDITKHLKEPYTFWEIARWPLLALAVAALAWVIVYVVRRLRNHQPIIALAKPQPVPPYDTAMRQIEELRVKRLWQQGLLKEYYTDLTDTVRQYIEAEFGIAATDMTTDQTLEALTAVAYRPKDTDDQMRQLLDTADMVKFAKAEPLGDVHDQAMNLAVGIVKGLHEAEEAHKQPAEGDTPKTKEPSKN